LENHSRLGRSSGLSGFPDAPEPASNAVPESNQVPGHLKEREAHMKIPRILPPAILIVLASLVLAACSTMPVDELKMAGDAMNNANNVEASEYATHEWKRAEMQRQEANALIHMGRYSEARTVLVEAIASYKEAQAKAKERVEGLQVEIKALQSSAETELKKIEEASESSKVKPSVRRRLEAALPRLDEKISAMNAAFDAGKYSLARTDGAEATRYMERLLKRQGISQ